MMSKMNHGKVVGDQGFGMLRNMIAYKGNLVKVNPKNTSKTCQALFHLFSKSRYISPIFITIMASKLEYPLKRKF